MVLAGRAELFRAQWFGDFYDAQAHSLLDGRWDVPREVLSLEAFVVDDRAYTYFGPTPALLRLPVAAVTDRLDGRLTVLSMLLAFGLALVVATRLHWQVRCLLRGHEAVGRAELVTVAVSTFALGAGSSLLYVGSRAYVYHEAILWGVALALAGLDALVGHLRAPSWRRLALVSSLATLALLARAAGGAAALAALGLVAAVALVRPTGRSRRHRAGLVAAAAMPVLAYAAVNLAKFDSLFSVPFDAQVVSQMPARQELLEENGGTLFGAKYVPSTVLQYARPDALATDDAFPFLIFPGEATVLGGVTFDDLDFTSSLTVGMPALVAAAAIGAVALVRDRRLAVLRLPASGAAVATGTTLAIGYLAHRYTADFVPVLVVCGAVGVQTLLAVRAPWRRVAAGGLAALVVVGVVVNGALALVYQRLLSPTIEDEVRADMIGFQADVAGGWPDRVRRGDELPGDGGRRGELFVAGDCEALYWSDGGGWSPVERTAEAGYLRLRGPVAAGQLVDGVVVEPAGDGRVRLAGGGSRGIAVRVGAGEHDLDVIADQRLGFLTVRIDGRRVLEGFWSDDPPAPGPRLRERPFTPTVCRSLAS